MNCFFNATKVQSPIQLPEDDTQGLLDLADRMEFDVELAALDGLQVVAGNDDMAETQFLGFGDALFDAVDGTDFATKTNFTRHAPARFNGGIDV